MEGRRVRDELVVVRLRLGPFWNFCYIAGSRRSGEAVVIDPAWDVPAILDRVAEMGLRVTAAAVTHAHDDHAHGLEQLVRATGADVLVNEHDAADLASLYSGPVRAVSHASECQVGDLRLRMLHTPGHTPGSQSALVDGALFTGDTLLVGALGRIGTESGAHEAMWHTVREVLAPLPDTTRIYPGHDAGPRPDSTLGAERSTNPLLCATSFAEFTRGG